MLVVSLQFKPTSTRTKTYAEFLTVKENNRNAEFFLSRGKWRISLFGTPSKLLLVCVESCSFTFAHTFFCGLKSSSCKIMSGL